MKNVSCIMAKRTIHSEQITYVRDDKDTSKSPRLYRGLIVRISGNYLQRAHSLLSTITDQHLRVGIVTKGISHCYYYRGGVKAYVYGPESLEDICHIKVQYGGILPLLEMLYALNLPVPKAK